MPRKKKKEYVVPFEGEEAFILNRGVYDNSDFLIAPDATGAVGVNTAIGLDDTYMGVVAPPDGGTKTPPLEPTGGTPTGGGGQTPTGGGDGGQGGAPTTGGTRTAPPLPSLAEIDGYTCDQLKAKIDQLTADAQLYVDPNNPALFSLYRQTIIYANSKYTSKCSTTKPPPSTPPPTTTVTNTTQLIPSLGGIGGGFGSPIGEDEAMPLPVAKKNYAWVFIVVLAGAIIYFSRKKK